MLDSIKKFLNKNANEHFISVDIGSSNIKLSSITCEEGVYKLDAIASCSTPVNSVVNNNIVEHELVGKSIAAAVSNNDIPSSKVVYSLPGPSVFTKKITTMKVDLDSFEENLSFEAASYIPNDIGSVKLDFQVLSSDENEMEVLLVAVKDEILESYRKAIEASGLEPAVADVDYFALSNMHELNYPEDESKLIALLDVGSKYTGVSLIKNRTPYFTGDIAVGGGLYTDAVSESLGLDAYQAELAKLGTSTVEVDQALLRDALDRTTDFVAGEIHRQLGFFWTAAELDVGIEKVYLSGGACDSHGLIQELRNRTGIECEIVNPYKGVTVSPNLDRQYLDKMSNLLSPSIGLGIRKIGDKENAQ